MRSIFNFLDHSDDNWVTPNMPAMADVMSKVLRKRIKDDQVKPMYSIACYCV